LSAIGHKVVVITCHPINLGPLMWTVTFLPIVVVFYVNNVSVISRTQSDKIVYI
jgi:hypothetical protein